MAGIQGDKDRILRITFLNQLSALAFQIVGVLLIVPLLIYLHFDKIFVMVSIFIVLAQGIPAIYLHIQYYLIDKGKEIEIENDRIMVRSKNGEERIFKFTDISKIVINKSGNNEENGIPIAAFEMYYYVTIFLTNNQKLLITNLMSRELEEVVKEIGGVDLFRSRRILASPSLESRNPKLVPLTNRLS